MVYVVFWVARIAFFYVKFVECCYVNSKLDTNVVNALKYFLVAINYVHSWCLMQCILEPLLLFDDSLTWSIDSLIPFDISHLQHINLHGSRHRRPTELQQ